MAAVDTTANTYEEARKQRVEENKRRFQDMGILAIKQSLMDVTSSEKKPKQRLPKPKSGNTKVFELRRSSRARNSVSYREDLEIDLPSLRKSSRSNFSSSYIARPLDEIKMALPEERMFAMRAAEEFQNSLSSGNPSFVKSMVRSHVYSCFWLGLPTYFCKYHLPQRDLDMTLEDENGSEHDAKYLGKRVGLSGGWRGFALDHKLDDGDAVVFELVQPQRFKVYIFRVSSLLSSKKHDGDRDIENPLEKSMQIDVPSSKRKKQKKAKCEDQNGKLLNNKKAEQQNGTSSEEKSEDVSSTKNGVASQEHDEKGELSNPRKPEEVQVVKDAVKHRKPRKKAAPRLFRKRP